MPEDGSYPPAGLDRAPGSTLSDVRTGGAPWPATWGRRLATLVLLAVVVVAGAGLLGVRSATVTSSAKGYSMTLTYPRFARAGLDVPFSIDVTAPQPFAGATLVLRVSRAYLAIFETQGLNPEAADETANGDTVQWQFTTPDQGTRFSADFDAYIQPASQIGQDVTVELLLDRTSITSVRAHTTLVP
ncbi:hypothetical protein [Nakamurella endophytica]|uniref:Uncharacterized protein n=1 Tax=Nakamurella endophytica TaxID=1748367 RepID=A0A917WCY8_9ACTN|nr:hypothetical protein [Nakamurella endophytica]GGL92892.1 hypothetical protein GCM10011594_10910 [Nakamurella endophytica]